MRAALLLALAVGLLAGCVDPRPADEPLAGGAVRDRIAVMPGGAWDGVPWLVSERGQTCGGFASWGCHHDVLLVGPDGRFVYATGGAVAPWDPEAEPPLDGSPACSAPAAVLDRWGDYGCPTMVIQGRIRAWDHWQPRLEKLFGNATGMVEGDGVDCGSTRYSLTIDGNETTAMMGCFASDQAWPAWVEARDQLTQDLRDASWRPGHFF